jgi:hypothetical protein
MSFSNSSSKFGTTLILTGSLTTPAITLNKQDLKSTINALTTKVNGPQTANTLMSGCVGADLILTGNLSTPTLYLESQNVGSILSTLTSDVMTLTTNMNDPKIASSLAEGCSGTDLSLSDSLTTPSLYIGTQNVGSALSTFETYMTTNHEATLLAPEAIGSDLTLTERLTTPSLYINEQNVASTLSTLIDYTTTNHPASSLDSGATGSNLTLSGSLSADSITATTSLSAPKVIISSNNSNTSYGYLAGNVVTGNKNTLIGYKAGNVLTTGANNTCIGNSAASITISSQNCTIIGNQAGNLLTAGSNNVLVGHNAGAVIAGASNQGNTMVGTNAGSATTGVSYCTYLGNGATGSNSASNETALGNGTTGSGSNTVTIGNTAVTNTYLKGIVNCSSITCSGTVVGAAAIISSSAYTTNGSTVTSKYIPSTVGNKFYLCNVGDTTFYLPQTSIAGTEVVFRRTYLSGATSMIISSYDGTSNTLVPNGSITPTNTINLSPETGVTSASFVFYGGVWYQY